MTTPRAAAPELHLPDLPDLQLGGADPSGGTRPRRPQRLAQRLAGWLPLLLMGAVALGTGWLVRHTPTPAPPPAAAAQRLEPDYTMRSFSITRFDTAGRPVLRIEGDQLHHFPHTDRLEIDGVRIHVSAPDGRVTEATAQRAVANGDGSEVQLIGGAQVNSALGGGRTLEVRGEFLHAFLRFERLRSHRPVTVRHAGTETRAGGLDYDNLQRTLQLAGPVRVLWPPGRAGRQPEGAAP